MIPIEETGYSQYTGTGSRTLFEYGFTVHEDSQVRVLVDGVTPVYEQQSNGVVITPAPVLNAVVELYRYTDVTQLRDWVPFDSFDAEWTEDACDKLIMLKQEVWYRLQMNLASEHLLDRVILHNDKGTDAHIFLWNEVDPLDDIVISEAGVFAGEVTTDMPEPGTYVLKPEDFAYFQYGTAPVFNELVLTSTLFPIEVEDGVNFGATVDFTAVWSWPDNSLDIVHSQTSISMTDGLITGPTEEDALDIVHSQTAISMTSNLITGPTQEDPLDISFSQTAIDMAPALVSATAREDGARFGAVVEIVDVSPVGAQVYDRFNELAVTPLNAHTPDIDTVGAGWIHRIQSASVNLDGEVEITSNFAPAVVTIDSGVSDGVIIGHSMDMYKLSSDICNTGIVFRYVDNSNYWWFGLNSLTPNPWTWALFRVVGGSQVAVVGPTAGITGGNASIEPDLIVTLTADSIRAQLISEGIDFNIVDSAHQTATEHGLRFVNVSSPAERASCGTFEVV